MPTTFTISSQVPASQPTSSMTLDQLVLFLKSESEVLYLCIISFFSPFWSQPHELLSKLMKMQGNAMIGLWLMDMSKVVDDIADFKVGFGESIAKTLESESLTAGAISQFHRLDSFVHSL